MKRLTYTLILLFLPVFISYSTEQFIFTSISQKHGLTSKVNCIYKELDGDVWIGTPNGLFRFNGNSLSRCEEDALQGNIQKFLMDKQNNFWILTTTGLVCRRKGEDSFVSEQLPAGHNRSPFHSACLDEEGIWFGSYRKIFRYSYSTGKVEMFKSLSDRPVFICKSISRFNGNSLLCSSLNGMILLNTDTGEISEAPFCSRTEVAESYIDSHGYIWTSLYNNGIEVYDKEGNLIRKYTASQSGLSCDIVLCFTELNGRIWAGTDGGGINIIDLERDSITILSHISGDRSSFPAHSIKSIYVDDHKNVWAGSIRDGLIKVSRSGMKTYPDVHIGMNNGLSNPTVLCIYQDADSDMIWLGTDGEGINRFNPNTNEFTHYAGTLRNKVVSISGYSDTELAMSVYSDMIWLFNKNTGNIRPLVIDDPHIRYQIRYSGLSINLYDEDKDNLLLLGDSVRRYSKKTGKCTEIVTEEGHVPRGNMFTIGRTEEGIWIHDAYSLYLLPEGSGIMKCKTDIDTRINSAHIGTDGIIWIATEQGLCRYDILDSIFEFIDTHLFKNAVSVVCDSNSRVWIGSDNALYAYLPDSERFALFGPSDGASSNEYLPKPRLLSNKGEVYMGGVNGLLYIDKSYSIEPDESLSVRLDNLEVDHNRISPDKDQKYTLPSGCKTVSIGVNVQEKDIFRQKRFRFHLSSDRIIETTLPNLLLQQIPSPGTYDIHVSCTERNGDWSQPEHILTLTVPKPWYKTWWFLICTGAFTAALSFGITFNIKKRNANRRELARREHEQTVYEEKVRMLINISHELRTPLTLIIAPLKRLLNEMEPGAKDFSTLNRVYRQSLRMKDIVNMVLELRKMEVGANRLQLEKVKFNRWISAEVEDFILEEKTEGIEIVIDADPDLTMVDLDMKKCETVMMNIMINAVKHSVKGDTITVTTTLTEKGMARVSISDQGSGLSDIDTSRLFTRFYQGSKEQYGSGIGLSYSKIMIELHGGSIGAYNNEDKGSTFWWEIPVKSIAASQNEEPERAYLNELLGYDIELSYDENNYDTSTVKMMIVDDNEDLLDFLKDSFSKDFAEIMTFTSGNKALSHLSYGKLPDIVISDVNMADGDGFTLCSEIKKNDRYSHIPVILLTARNEERSQGDSYRAGADAFLAKPFETETLLDLIRGQLKKRESIRKKYLDSSGENLKGYGSNEESFIIRLNEVIARNIDNPELNQQLLCKELGMSRATLFNKMKAISGTGAKEYITKKRIEKAKHLLETTDKSLVEISEMTGFASQSYFSTAFKTSVGMTPSQYKKKG